MSEAISRFRKQIVARRQRRATTPEAQRRPFKDSSFLALLYASAIFFTNFALLGWVHSMYVVADWKVSGGLLLAGCVAITLCAIFGA